MTYFQLMGEVEAHIREIDTNGNVGPILQIHKKTNLVTDVGMYAVVAGGILGPFIGISADATPTFKQNPHVNYNLFYGPGFVAPGDTSPLWFEENLPTPMYAQFKQRFDPPIGSSRTIFTIMLAPTNFNAGGGNIWTNFVNSERQTTLPLLNNPGWYESAYVTLDTPCTQTVTQVLDVFYRLKWIIPNTFHGIGKKNIRRLARRAVGIGGEPFISIGFFNWNATLGSAGIADETFQFSANPGATTGLNESQLPTIAITNVPARFARKTAWTLSATQLNGYILGSQLWGTNSDINGFYGWAPITLPSTSAVQPVHNHSSGTSTPFQDVNFLATGSGRVAATGNWTNPDYPKLFKINIIDSGNIGVSTYQFSVRPMFGFDGQTLNVGSYTNRDVTIPWFTYGSNGPNTFTNGMTPHNMLEVNFSSSSNIGFGQMPHSIEKYNFTSVITYDATGITYASLITSDVRNFDDTSVPSLSVSAVKQVSVAGDGRVWVACGNTGLHWVNPISNTVTTITIPGVTQQCYGVDIGRGGRIWALMKGGLCQSNDNGVTWTIYNSGTIPAFSFVGITDDSDNNWSTVAYLRADPIHVDDRIALVRDNATAVLQTTAIVWWSVATATPVAIVSSNLAMTRLHSFCFNVSDTDSFWAGYASDKILYKFTYGSSTLTSLMSNIATSLNGGLPWAVYFEKNSSNVDCVFTIASGSTTSANGPNGGMNVLFTSVALVPPVGGTAAITFVQGTTKTFMRPCYMGKGIWTFLKQTYFNGVQDRIEYSGNTSAIVYMQEIISCQNFSNSPTGGPLAYIGLDSYGWDGANWALNNINPKPTHLASQILTEGISCSFTEGITPPSFVATDHYTFGVCSGLLKDNATTAQGSMNFYFASSITSSDFDGGGVVGALSVYSPNTLVTWSNPPVSGFSQTLTSITLAIPSTRSDGFTLISNELLTGDFSVEWTGVTPVTAPTFPLFGIGDQFGNLMWGFTPIGTQGSFCEWDFAHAFPSVFTASGVNTGSIVSWRFSRVGNSLTMHINGVLKRTNATAFLDNQMPVRVLHNWPKNITGSFPVPTILTNTAINGVVAGIVGNSTGKYDANFNLFDDNTNAMSFTLNGTPVAAIWTDGNLAPGINEVALCSSARAFICNAADIGKTLAGTYTYVKYPNT